MHTIVLCHGYAVPSDLIPAFDFFHGIPATLRGKGAQVLVATAPPFGSIHERATNIRSKIEAHFHERRVQKKVHLIGVSASYLKVSYSDCSGMSMGGLDCRYLASLPNLEFEVLSVTTVGTPNHGTRWATFLDFLTSGSSVESVCQ